MNGVEGKFYILPACLILFIMADIINLGGNIELSGIETLDPASMVILKKMVGNYARQFSEKTNLQKLSVSISSKDGLVCLNSVLVTDSLSFSSECSDKNLFFALDLVLKQIENELK